MTAYFLLMRMTELSLVQLRDKVTVKVNNSYAAMNFGNAKGLTFDRVLIYPTKPLLDWIKDHSKSLKPEIEGILVYKSNL